MVAPNWAWTAWVTARCPPDVVARRPCTWSRAASAFLMASCSAAYARYGSLSARRRALATCWRAVASRRSASSVPAVTWVSSLRAIIPRNLFPSPGPAGHRAPVRSSGPVNPGSATIGLPASSARNGSVLDLHWLGETTTGLTSRPRRSRAWMRASCNSSRSVRPITSRSMSFGEGPGSPVARAAPTTRKSPLPLCLQSSEFFPEDLGRAESDGDEVAQRAIEGRFLVCPVSLVRPTSLLRRIPAASSRFTSRDIVPVRCALGVPTRRSILAIPDVGFRQDCSCDTRSEDREEGNSGLPHAAPS